MAHDNYDLDFDFDNFEEELEKKINSVKSPYDLKEVVDDFLADIDVDFGLDMDEDDEVQLDVFKD